MAIEIIPDRTCPHCGGNEWNVVKCKDRANPKYVCRKRAQENSHRSHLKNKEENQRKRKILIEEGYYRTDECRARAKAKRENLTDAYVKGVIASSGKKKYKDVSPEEVLAKRKEIIKRRKQKNIPAEIRRKKVVNKSRKKEVRVLSIRYIKLIIRQALKYYKIPSTPEFYSDENVERVRDRIKMARIIHKYKTDGYIINAILMANRSADDFIIIKDQITQEDIKLYRESLMAKRKYWKKVKEESIKN